MTNGHAGVALPIRSFRHSNSRITLSQNDRSRLARYLATNIVAATQAPMLVISSDVEVRSWAADQGLAVFDDPGTLNEAAALARAAATELGWHRVVIAHADLAQPAGIDDFVERPAPQEVWAVRSHRDNGTPVMSLPTEGDFEFEYGIGSFDRHQYSVAHAGWTWVSADYPALMLDVDLDVDLELIDGFRH